MIISVKRAAPYLLFACVTLAVFWRFIAFGHTMYAMSAVETQLGQTPQEPRGWFRSSLRHARISDNVVVLAGHLRLYNEGLKANELRLWNPGLFCGLPTYADPMIHPFYPPNLLLHRLFAPDTAYELGMMLHLFFSGVAMFLALRAAGRTDLAATAGGLVWMLIGYNAMWFSTAVLAGATVFGPLALLAILKGLEARDLRHAGWAGAAMGLAILGTHPQHALLLFLLLLGWILAAGPRPFAFRFGGLFALLAVGVGMAEILTRLDTIENGYRDPQFDRLALYAEPGRLATYVSGLILGKVYYPGAGWEAEFAVFCGLGAAGLAVVGAIRNWNDRRVRYAAIAGVAALALAFFYPFAWLFTKIPFLNLSPPSRCLFVAGLSIAWLAAHGLDALAADLGRARSGFAGITAPFVLLTIVGIGPLTLSNGAAIETALGFALVTGAAFAAARWKRAAAALAFAALLFELLPPFLQFNAHSDSSLLSRVPEGVLAMKDPGRGTGVLGSTARTNKSEQWGNDLVTGNNLLALYGVKNIGGFDAIIPRHYVSFAMAAGGRLSPAGRTIQFTRLDSPLLDAAALRYALLPPALPMPSRYRKLGTYNDMALYENPSAQPRARLVSVAKAARDEQEAERLVRDPAFDPFREVVVEADAPRQHGVGTVIVKEETSDRVVLEVMAKQGGILVLADTDYPGWEATVNGKPAPIRRANLAFRAVEVPETAVVEFRFRPASARHGLIASLLFLPLSIALAFYRRRE
jgi:hypothetical protein